MFNAVAPYRYLLHTVYLFMGDIANPGHFDRDFDDGGSEILIRYFLIICLKSSTNITT